MKKKEDIPQEIPGMPRKIPFGVPDNYFESFPDRLQERLSEQAAPSIERVYPLRRALAMAAMFIGLVTVGYFGLRMILNPQDASMLSGAELDTAIEYFAYEFDDEMLVAAMVESEMDFGLSDLDDETEMIIEYLSSEEIDISELIID